jgi:dihydrofolate reductase
MDDAGQSTGRTHAAPGMRAERRLALIAAVARNGVIGADGRLPWRLPADLRRFRALTVAHAVIMGRKTWESLPRALPERQNIVITRRSDYSAAGAEVVGSLDDALDRVARPDPVFVIGGGELYRATLARATVLYLTEIEESFDGDVTFPGFDRSEWTETSREPHDEIGEHGTMRYFFVTYERQPTPQRG